LARASLAGAGVITKLSMNNLPRHLPRDFRLSINHIQGLGTYATGEDETRWPSAL
jgi:hypothetical protein